MTHQFKGLLFSATAALLALTALLNVQVLAVDYFWQVGTSDWNDDNNWDSGFTPEASFEEVGIINNGGTATLNTVAKNTQAFVGENGVVPGAVAGLILGQAAGESGTLRVTSGGVINFVDSSGEPQGFANIGLDGTGVLEVQGGGSLSATSLDMNVGSSIIVGSGTGSATIGSTSTTWLGGTTTIHGAGHTFTVGGDVFLEGSGDYSPILSSSSSNTVLNVAGSASLGGNLQIGFASGYSPSLGDNWDLIDATSVTGNFDNAPGGIVPVTGANAPVPGAAYRLHTVDGGANGEVLQMSLQGLLMLQVNRDTGAMNIVNPAGAAVPSLDGYTITSGAGSLLAGYKGISGAPAADSGWEKAPMNSTTGLAEFKPTGGFDVSATSTDVSLGTGFSKTAVASQGLGVFGEDLTFSYHTTSGEVTIGLVEYVGTTFLNNIALVVNTDTGHAILKNDTLESIAIDGYSIVSSTDDLVGTGWTGLGSTLANWQKSPAAANALSETNSVGPSTLSAGQSISLGTIGDFSSQEAQDGLAMKFIIGDESRFRFATVAFTSGAGIAGDFDGNGKVNGADFLLWQRNPGVGNLADWKANYGAGSSATVAAVPEPAALSLMLLGSVALLGRRRRRFSKLNETRKENRMKNRLQTLHCLRSTGVIAASLCIAMLHVSTTSAQILGLNFAASDPSVAESTLASTDVAGVVPIANWNNLELLSGTGVSGLFYDNAGSPVASTVSLDWNSPNTWRSGGNNAFPAGPDHNLLSGYLDTGDTTETGITITISGIDAALLTPFYDVYVYFVSDSNEDRGGAYTVDDGVTSILQYGSTQGSPSAYTLDPGTDVDNSLDGNFLRFRGLTGSSLTITSDTTLTTPNGFRAPINAVEIVATNVGPGDANEDGTVDIGDYNLIKANLEKSVPIFTLGDLDGNRFVDLNDFRSWTAVAPLSALIEAGVAVPEPATATLAGAFLFGLLGMRRRSRRSVPSESATTVPETSVAGGRRVRSNLLCATLIASLCLATSTARATVAFSFGATAPTPGTYDQYDFTDDAVIPGGTTPGGGTYNSQAFSDNNGPPGQLFTTPASASAALPAFTVDSIWLKGAEASTANTGGIDAAATWAVRISEVNGTLLTPVRTVTGIPNVTGFLGDEWFEWTFSGGDLQSLSASKQYAFDLYSSTGYLGFDADTSDSYAGGTAFNSGGGAARSFAGLTTGNLADHLYDRTFLVGLTPSLLFGPGDVNNDGDTDLADYMIIKTNFFLQTGATRAEGDLTGDGMVSLDDYVLWKNNAASSVVAQAAAIPEPGSLVLAFIGAGLMAGLRRGRRGAAIG